MEIGKEFFFYRFLIQHRRHQQFVGPHELSKVFAALALEHFSTEFVAEFKVLGFQLLHTRIQRNAFCTALFPVQVHKIEFVLKARVKFNQPGFWLLIEYLIKQRTRSIGASNVCFSLYFPR